MWKCPKCETVNNGERCIICGENKPASNYSSEYNNQNHNCPDMVQTQENVLRTISDKRAEVTEAKTNKGIIALCITLGVLLLATIILVLIIVLNNANNEDRKNYKHYDVEHEEQDYESEDYDEDYDEEFEDESEPSEEQETDIYLDADDPDSYLLYSNYMYDFSCAYPVNFREVKSEGMNAVKAFESIDGNALMTIRACENTYGIDIETAMNDFYSVIGAEVTYDASGDTWYASSVDLGDRLLYRKCFIDNGNILCFDFEFDEIDVDYYGDLIEYIEDNFKSF